MVSNVVFFTECVTSVLHFGKQVDAVYLDFSKAFYTVDHSILYQKLKMYDFSGNYLSLMICRRIWQIEGRKWKLKGKNLLL